MSNNGSFCKKVGLFLGPAVFFVVLLLLKSSSLPDVAIATAATGALMAIWWATETIPIAVTSLIPLIIFPLFKISSLQTMASSYGHRLIFLFLGGFILAQAMEKWGLHKRIALSILQIFGLQPQRILIGFMMATALTSMWVTNTATTMMMLPIAISIINIYGEDLQGDFKKAHKNFSIALLLGVAYSANVGGLATLIGTVPNSLFAAFVADTYQTEIQFVNWMTVGLPICLGLLPVIWLCLAKICFPFSKLQINNSQNHIHQQLKELGAMSRQEGLVLCVLVVTCSLWIFRPHIQSQIPNFPISDTSIAIASAVSLFIIPANFKQSEFLMTWERAVKIPWGTLLLFGGGLALAAAVKSSGLSEWLGSNLTFLQTSHPLVQITSVSSIIIFLTEMTSNTATTATFLPIGSAIAAGQLQTALPILLAITVSASCAFMLPVATPPNAIVYGSGIIKIRDMIRAGCLLNMFSIIIVSILSYFLAPYLLS